MKKITLLAASVAVALAGCGSDSDSGSPGGTPGGVVVVNEFIDAAVEGMYYTSSTGESGLTDSNGGYEANESSTVTFYIGGENGLKVGAASNRDVLTPFEAAGKYERAVNLAILLQSLDADNGADGMLSLPESLKSPDQTTLGYMKDLSLDDYDSVETFLNNMGIASGDIVSADDALAHMDSTFGVNSGLTRGSSDANPFVKKDGSYIRSITVRQYDIENPVTNPNDKTILVHADKMLPTAVFENTRGMPYYVFQDTANGLVVVSDSDTSYSGTEAEGLIYCELNGGNYGDGCETNSDSLFELSTGSGPFSYLLLDKSKENNTPSPDDYGWEPFIENGTQQDLNHYTPTVLVDDRNDGAPNASYQYETHSGSYDPVTGIYTQIRTKTELVDPTNSTSAAKRIEESLDFYYHVDSPSAEKYVDFTGTWDTTQICANGEKAVMRMVFNANGADISGQECVGNAPGSFDGTGPITFEELASIDYWWFGQTGREKYQATLTELNSVVRFCDDTDNGYVPGSGAACPQDFGQDQEYFIKWEYQPAGENWDEGLLIRRKMTPNGSTTGQVSIMQKVN